MDVSFRSGSKGTIGDNVGAMSSFLRRSTFSSFFLLVKEIT
jgi:hypothetical protein